MPSVEDELVPGTVYILSNHESVSHTYSNSDIILRPTPSNDPGDPLVSHDFQ